MLVGFAPLCAAWCCYWLRSWLKDSQIHESGPPTHLPAEFSGAMEFCPVCMLRKGLAGGVESGESSFEEAVRPTPDHPPKRFDHYELVTGEDI
jgi:hypothetical protein